MPVPAPSVASPKIEGALDAGVFRDTFFSLSCTVPFGWVDRTDDMQDGDSSEGRVLLAVFSRPPEAQGNTVNSAIVIAAEKLPETYKGAGLELLSDALETAKARGFALDGDPYEFKINAKTILRGDLTRSGNGPEMHQAILIAVQRGYQLTLTLIGENSGEIDQLIAGIHFTQTK